MLFLCNFSKAQISPVGSYDSCGAAIDLTVNATCVTGGNTYTTTGATTSPQLSTGISNDDDVWFKFTTLAGQTDAQIQITNASGGMGNCMELWTSCSATSSLADACGDIFNVTSLSPSTTYFIRVYTNGTFATLSTFKMCVVNTTPPPALPNNECAFATLIPISNYPANCTPIPLTTNNTTASANPPSCLSSNYRDIWLKFIPSTNNSIKFLIQNYTATVGSSSPIFYAAVYSGTCSSPALINCGTVFTNNEIALSGTYTVGNTYYVRLLCENTNQGTFEVCMKQLPTTAIYPTAADSTCSKAISINSSTDQSAIFIEGSTNGITVKSQFACYGYNAPNALAWYSFTVPSSGNYLIDFKDFVRLSVNQNGAGFRLLKRNTCYTTGTDTIITTPPPNTYDTVKCVNSIVNDNQTVSLTSGTQYYLTVMENSYNGGRVAYKLRVVGTTPPSNDESSGATTVVQDITCAAGNNATTFRFSTLSSNPSTASLPGNASFSQDVWYKFVATTASVNIVSNRPSAVTRIIMYENNVTTIKYDPTIPSSSITVNSLAIGNTYYIRVINTSGTPVSQQADFTLCVFGPPASIASTVSSCTSADAVNVSTNSGTWLNFYKSGSLVLSVFDGPAYSGATFTPRGNISVQYFTNTGGLRLNAGTSVLDRNFEITAGGNNFTNSPVKVRLYFTVSEFNTLITDAASGGISAPYELRVYRIPGANCTSTIPVNGIYYNIVGSGYLSNPSDPFVPTGYYIDMITPNFSGFFLQYADNSVLPAICNNFSYKIQNEKAILSFSTLTENNAASFDILRSEDGANYLPITKIEAKNSLTESNYNFTDETIKPNKIYYYRLKLNDKDGKEQFICNTLKVRASEKSILFSNVYPNPTKNNCRIDVLRPITGKVDVQIINVLGQTVQQQSFQLTSSTSQLTINTNNIKQGVYLIRMITSNEVHTQQLIKW